MQSMVETPYTLNLQRSQNCDAMVRHLFGEERQERCTRCVQGKGALLGCITTSSSKVCTNCDWNRSGICSLSSTEPRQYLVSEELNLLLIFYS